MMTKRETTKLIAQNVIDYMHDHINEVTETQEQVTAVLSQIKILLK